MVVEEEICYKAKQWLDDDDDDDDKRREQKIS